MEALGGGGGEVKQKEGGERRVVGMQVGMEVREEEEGEEVWGDYDPRRPTGCGVGCPGWVVEVQ